MTDERDTNKPSFWDTAKKTLVKVAKNMKEAQKQSSNTIASKDEIQSLAKGITRMNDNLIGTARVNYNDSLHGTSGIKFPDFERMSGVSGTPKVPDTKVKVKTPKFVDKEEYAYDAVEHKPIKVKKMKNGTYVRVDEEPVVRVRTDFLEGDNNILTGKVTKKRRK
jgi:hypothetical protein